MESALLTINISDDHVHRIFSLGSRLGIRFPQSVEFMFILAIIIPYVDINTIDLATLAIYYRQCIPYNGVFYMPHFVLIFTFCIRNMEVTSHILQVLSEFYMLERRLPSHDELAGYLLNVVSINTDAQQYCDEHVIEVSRDASNILTRTVYTGEDSIICTMCRDPIDSGVGIYSLPCGHIFHIADGDDSEACLGSGQDIRYWLSHGGTRCPNCNTDFRDLM